MPSSTVENYVKQIYLESLEVDGDPIQTGQLAQALSVTPGTVTSMLKTLSSAGLVDYEPRTGVHLTSGGRELALHVLRRHRLIEQFLVEVLKLDWSEVHEEAEQLEHVISDKVLERMDDLLGFPSSDPHGDPIPSSDGEVTVPSESCLLADLDQGEEATVSRIIDQDPHFLRYLREQGLVPGIRIKVDERDPRSEVMTIELSGEDGQHLAVGHPILSKVMVDKAP